MMKRMKLAAAIAAFAGLLATAPARAAQIVALDEDYTHTKWYYHFKFKENPSNWISPNDYAHGTAYFRVDVRSAAKDWRAQTCFFQGAHTKENHACFTSRTITI